LVNVDEPWIHNKELNSSSAEDIATSVSQETNSALKQTNKKNPFLIIPSCEATDSNRDDTASNF